MLIAFIALAAHQNAALKDTSSQPFLLARKQAAKHPLQNNPVSLATGNVVKNNVSKQMDYLALICLAVYIFS